MKIALIGYGKMGKEIEKIALAKGHEIVLKISTHDLADFTAENIKRADVCIEFSTPDTAFQNVKKCLEAGVPVVCGTTAWLTQLEEAKSLCIKNNTAFLYASNFSIGVNLFFALNKHLAKLMQVHTEYNVQIEEIHHTQKKDAPSGTAVTLAEGILENSHIKKSWINTEGNNPTELSILSKRIDPAPGTHTITYSSPIDDISITHTAHNRQGFATGALLAAEFLVGKKGVFEISDVLGM